MSVIVQFSCNGVMSAATAAKVAAVAQEAAVSGEDGRFLVANSAYTFVMDLTTSEHKTAHVAVTAMGPGDAQLAGIESNYVGKIAAGTA